MPATFVRINLPAISHNVRQVLSQLDDALLMAVVKGNAYGHGLVHAAQQCVAAGAHWLGVSYVDEGVRLREDSVASPTLAFVPPTQEQCAVAVQRQITVTVTTEEHLAWLRTASEQMGETALAQIFVDADLGRPSAGDDLMRLIEIAAGFPQLQITGVYTHFDGVRAAPVRTMLDVVQPHAELQAFAATIKKLARQYLGRDILFHAAASATFLTQPEARLDMVRVGTLLYGQYPAGVPDKSRSLELNADTFQLCSTIIAIDELPSGAAVGYGREFICRRPTRVATLPIGYAHGLSLLPKSLARRRYAWWRQLLGQQDRAAVLVAGQRAPLIGRIGMDQCAVDVTDVPQAQVGTLVTVPARRTAISPDVPRIYVE